MQIKTTRRKKLPFTQVDDIVLENKKISGYAKMVFVILCKFANNDTQECFPSFQTLSDETGFSKNTVLKGMNELIEVGFVEKKAQYTINGKQKSNLYIITTEYTPIIREETVCPHCNDSGMLRNKENELMGYCTCEIGRKRNALSAGRKDGG